MLKSYTLMYWYLALYHANSDSFQNAKLPAVTNHGFTFISWSYIFLQQNNASGIPFLQDFDVFFVQVFLFRLLPLSFVGQRFQPTGQSSQTLHYTVRGPAVGLSYDATVVWAVTSITVVYMQK